MVVTAVKRDSFASKAGSLCWKCDFSNNSKDIERPEQAKKIFDDLLKKKAESALLQVLRVNSLDFNNKH